MAMTLQERNELYTQQFTSIDVQIKQMEEELDILKRGREQLRGKIVLVEEMIKEETAASASPAQSA